MPRTEPKTVSPLTSRLSVLSLLLTKVIFRNELPFNLRNIIREKLFHTFFF